MIRLWMPQSIYPQNRQKIGPVKKLRTVDFERDEMIGRDVFLPPEERNGYGYPKDRRHEPDEGTVTSVSFTS